MHGLWSEAHNTSDAAAERDCPPASWRSVITFCSVAAGLVMPVCCNDRATIDIPALFQVVSDEVLQCHLVYRWAMPGTGNGPHVVDQESDRPMSRLYQGDHGRAKTQFPLTESCTRGCRKDNCGTETPDQLAGFCRRKEEGRVHVPNAVLSASVCGSVGLPDNRLNDARDQHPVFADASGNHRLNIEYVLRSVIGTDGKIRVVLNRNTDQAGDRILRGLGQVPCRRCSGGWCRSGLSIRGSTWRRVLRRKDGRVKEHSTTQNSELA